MAFVSYWFLYGNHDAYCGVTDNPPVTVGKAYTAYLAGQRAALEGRLYRKAWVGPILRA